MKIKNKNLISYFLDNANNKINTTKNINHFLDFFYEEILESIDNTDNLIENNLIKNIIKYPDNFNIITNTHFISEKIKNYIKNNTNFYYTFSFKINSTKIKIHFAIYNKAELEDLHNKLYIMICWLYIGIKYKTKNCSEYLNVYLFFTDFKKCLTEGVLGPENCNSGFTHACSLDNTICIFRKEEIVKVFIHETFHSLGLDFSYKSINVKKKMKKIFNIKSTFNISETYTETWATIINSLFFTFFKLNKYNKNNFHQYSKIMLNLETIFSIHQSIKVLNNMKLKYIDILKKNENQDCVYKEKTNVFSYYILKSLLLIHLSDFLNITKQHKYLNIQNENIFINLIYKIYNSKNVLNNYYNFENNSINYNTRLKMTICE